MSAKPGAMWRRVADPGLALLRGIAQVFLQGHAGAGACLLAAVAWQSPAWAAACLLGAATGTFLKMPGACRADTQAGLQGYNGALVGIGVLMVLPPSPLAWVLVVVLAGLATVLAQIWRRRLHGAPYTAPFILTIWLLLAAMAVAGSPPPAAGSSAGQIQGLAAIAAGVLRGVGQVMFLDDPWSGVLCVLGLACAAPRAAFRALGVSAAALLAAWVAGFPVDAVSMGMYGFNAVLAAEAVHQALPGRRAALWGGVALSLLLIRGFQWADAPALTAPFVLAAWTVRSVVRTPAMFRT